MRVIIVEGDTTETGSSSVQDMGDKSGSKRPRVGGAASMSKAKERQAEEHGNFEGHSAGKPSQDPAVHKKIYTIEDALTSQAELFFALYKTPVTKGPVGAFDYKTKDAKEAKAHVLAKLAVWRKMDAAAKKVRVHPRRVFLSAPLSAPSCLPE